VEDSTSRENENQELGLSQKSISDGVHDGYEAEKELELLLADNIEQRMEEGLEGPGPIRHTIQSSTVNRVVLNPAPLSSNIPTTETPLRRRNTRIPNSSVQASVAESSAAMSKIAEAALVTANATQSQESWDRNFRTTQWAVELEDPQSSRMERQYLARLETYKVQMQLYASGTIPIMPSSPKWNS